MLSFINFGPVHLGTFGIMLWLAAVCATIVLHKNFVRNGVDYDALNVVALVTIAGILGAKAWHELQTPHEMLLELHQIGLPGWKHPLECLAAFLHWFQAGFAWFGGLLAGIAMLMWLGRLAKTGAVRMLDLATPAAAIGYGVGRIGCLLAGDGDYGVPTKLPWGVDFSKVCSDSVVYASHFVHCSIYPTRPGTISHPTPVYELLFSLLIGWWLWKRGGKPRPLGWMTGEYLLLSGFGRFLVEFIRLNPKIYWAMSNAQVAALGSAIVGVVILLAARRHKPAFAATEPAPG